MFSFFIDFDLVLSNQLTDFNLFWSADVFWAPLLRLKNTSGQMTRACHKRSKLLLLLDLEIKTQAWTWPKLVSRIGDPCFILDVPGYHKAHGRPWGHTMVHLKQCPNLIEFDAPYVDWSITCRPLMYRIKGQKNVIRGQNVLFHLYYLKCYLFYKQRPGNTKLVHITDPIASYT